MKKSRKLSAAIALMLTVAVATPSVGNSGAEAAKKKPKLSTKSISVQVGKSKTVTVKNYSKKVTWKIAKPAFAKIKAKKNSCKVTGKKKGTTKLTASFKQGKKNVTLKCTVKVTAKKADTPTEAPATDAPTQAPAQPTVQAPANTPAPTEDPNATATPTPTHDYDADADCLWKQPGEKIKDLFDFKCGISTDAGSLRNGETAALVRYHFDSTTMGNETKHESLVNVNTTDDYPEGLQYANVENYYKSNGEAKILLNYQTLEDVLSYCKENGVQMRYHTFIWHSQAREYFFLKDYNDFCYDLDDYEEKGWDTSNYHKLADKETMKKRLNDYISQIIEYIYSHGYGEVVYAYDVINEATNGGGNYTRYYVNESATSVDDILSTSGSGPTFQTNGATKTSNGRTVTSDSSPEDVMDMISHNGRTPANDSYWFATMGPDYLYLAYLYAYNAIQENFAKYKDQFGYKEENLPSLIYNDYNGRASDHVALAKYINTACNIENKTNGVLYCKGVGIQAHSNSVSSQDSQIKTVVDAGLEAQITELDTGADGDNQASELKQLYQMYKKYATTGEYAQGKSDYLGLTSVTLWGICDADGSWSGDRIHNIFKYITEKAIYQKKHQWRDRYEEMTKENGKEPTIEEYAEAYNISISDPVYDAEDIELFEEISKGPVSYINIEPKPAYYGILQAGGVSCGAKEY